MASNSGATECFSGDCGLCNSCTNNSFQSFNSSNNRCKLSDRSEDLYKIMSKNLKEEAGELYNKNLMNWCKKYQYKDPYCYGYAPEIIKDDKGDKYKIIEKNHSIICDHVYCRMIYHSSSSWLQGKRYPIIPMYSRQNEYPLNLCGTCMTVESFRNNKFDLNIC